MFWSTRVIAATNSEPDVADSTVAYLFENQSPGVELMKWRIAVPDLPVVRS